MSARLKAPATVQPEDIVAAMEKAGITLLRMPTSRIFPAQLKAAWPSYVHDVAEAYGYHAAVMRPAAPAPADISAMDRAFSWITHIPAQFPTIRQIVLRRALVRPPETVHHEDSSDPHIWGWTRLATHFGLQDDGDRTSTGAKQVKRAHERGILMIWSNMDNY